MIYAFDAHYQEDTTRCVCLGFADWSSRQIDLEIIEGSPVTAEYISGAFYKRELPAILKILEKIELRQEDIIIVDGYVYIDDEKNNGLGGHLFEKINMQYPVIGVAKNQRKRLRHAATEVIRGHSQKPLYVSSVGIDLTLAAESIQQMAGEYRLPDMLRLLDQKTKDRSG